MRVGLLLLGLLAGVAEVERLRTALIDLVASVLSPLPDPQRTVLDLLALAGSVPTADVERLTGSSTVRSLLDQGFITPCPGGIRQLTLRHGLFGAVGRRRGPDVVPHVTS